MNALEMEPDDTRALLRIGYADTALEVLRVAPDGRITLFGGRGGAFTPEDVKCILDALLDIARHHKTRGTDASKT